MTDTKNKYVYVCVVGCREAIITNLTPVIEGRVYPEKWKFKIKYSKKHGWKFGKTTSSGRARTCRWNYAKIKVGNAHFPLKDGEWDDSWNGNVIEDESR